MDRIRHPAPNWLLAIWGALLVGAWMLASTSDYHEARKLECTSKTNPKSHFQVTWDSKTDTCRKEPKNGKTKKD